MNKRKPSPVVTKRYNAFSEELKRVFGCRVHRISVDAGFTCPNRDGSKGTDGCIYCGGKGSGAHGILANASITAQLEAGKEVMTRKYKAQRFLAYFQAYSNTYGPVEQLRRFYDEALAVKDVVGLIVGTRPDCLPAETLDLLGTYARQTYFWLELGLQSSLNRTLSLLNRGHSVQDFRQAAQGCRERGIRICAHIILGLPGETRDDMVQTAHLLNELGISGVKLHLLHVMKGTPLAELHGKGKVPLLDRDEYVGLVCDFLERLNPDMAIQRLTGDGGHEHLVAPLWSLKKFEVLNAIDYELERRNSRQGCRADSGGV